MESLVTRYSRLAVVRKLFIMFSFPMSSLEKKARRYLQLTGVRLRQLRESAGLSQEMLAEKAGIHDRTVSKIERGQLNFSVLILAALARGLDCQTTEILPNNDSFQGKY